MATDGAATHLFNLNAASLEPSSLRGGVLVTTKERETEFNQDFSGGATLTNKVSTQTINYAAVADLGAGAGIGLSHQIIFDELEYVTSRNPNTTVTESKKTTVSTGSLMVELTDEFRAAVAMRAFYSERVIYGASFLGNDGETRYVMPMAGPGFGGAYKRKEGGLGYMYYPPLAGKSTIQAEEYKVLEPGEIVYDGHYFVNKQWTIGIGGKRWIHDGDERTDGTTADDDTTQISLYGLDIDQYMRPETRIELAADYQMTKQVQFRFGISQQEDSFQFDETASFDEMDARQGGSQHEESVTYNRMRAMIKFVNKNLEIHAGLGQYTREHSLPDSMNGGEYKTQVRESFVTLDMKL
jgi:hypothetical protein